MSTPTASQQEESSQIVYTLPRHEGEELHFTLRKYNGHYYVDLRLWFQPDPKQEFVPTKKGISIAADRLPELQEGLGQLQKAFLKVQEWEKPRPEKPAQRFQKRQGPSSWTNRQPS